MGKTFIVGPKASYVSGGRSYKPGDEIDGGLFEEKALAAAIKGGHLIEKGKEPAAGGTGDNEKSLDEMTIVELRDYAAENKIPVTGNKADGLAAIKEAEAAAKAGAGETGGQFDALSDADLMALAAEKGIDPALGREAILEALKAKGEGN
jgi:hypothetical protein